MVMFREQRANTHTIRWDQATDSPNNNEFGAIANYRTYTGNEALQIFVNLFGRTITFDQWTIFVNTNTNVSDGAEFECRIGFVGTGQAIVIDQATGVFQLDDTIDLLTLQFISNQYHEGSVGGVPNTRSGAVRLNQVII